MAGIRIHTTVSPEARQYIQRIQDLGDGKISTAIESIIVANREADVKIKAHLLNMVINEVLDRYMIERSKQQK